MCFRILIQELADYEKMPEGPKISAEVLEKDGFGDEKFFHCFVAEQSDKSLIGFALYNITYSTWEGKQVYMEDLYVQPQYRGQGVGSKVNITLPVCRYIIERKEKKSFKIA